jgi:hypothetical protein
MKARDVTEILQKFEDLPDAAVVPRKVTALLTGMSIRTIRRNPPVPDRRITDDLIGHRVGDLRRWLAGKADAAVAAT